MVISKEISIEKLIHVLPASVKYLSEKVLNVSLAENQSGVNLKKQQKKKDSAMMISPAL
jgi:ethanolamine utilization cobalamin adenosyltransferase